MGTERLEFDTAAPPKPEPFRLPLPPTELPSRRFGVRHIMILVLVSALVLWLAINLGWVLLVLLIAVGIGAIFGIIALLIRSGATQREAMLWVVANAAEKGLPLAPGVLAYAELCGVRFRIKAHALAWYLDQGASLPDALDRVPDVFPRSGLIYTRMGWEPAALAKALRTVAQSRTHQLPMRNTFTLRLSYLIWTLVMLQLIFSFVMYWIVPKFEQIFFDFGMSLPNITLWMMAMSHVVVNSGILPLALLVQFVALVFLPLIFFDPLHWNLPIMDWWLARRHGAVVLGVLATEVEAGRPFTESFTVLSAEYPSLFVRRRLRRVARSVAGGGSWTTALASSGLIRRVDAALLDAAQRAGNLPWALGELSESIERRFGYRVLGWSHLLFPLAIIAVGAIVFLFALGILVPLFQMIQELAG